MKKLFSSIFALLTIFSIAGLSISAEKEEKDPGSTKSPVKKAPADPGKKVVKKAPPTKSPVKKAPADPGKKVVKKAPPAKSPVKVHKKTGSSSAKSVFNAVRNRCDENGDNAVTLAEFQQNQPPGKDEAAVEKWFHSRDVNQDGKLTEQDFLPRPSKKS